MMKIIFPIVLFVTLATFTLDQFARPSMKTWFKISDTKKYRRVLHRLLSIECLIMLILIIIYTFKK